MIFPPITVGQRLLILNTTWKHCQSIENMFKGWFLNISQVWVISRRLLDITKILSDQCHFNVKNSEGWFCPQITLRGQRLLLLNGTKLLCQHLVLNLTLGLGLYWGFPCRGCWFVFLMSNKLMSKLGFWGGLWAADWLLAAVLARADFLGGAAGHHLQHARLGYGQHSVHDELLLAVQEGAEATT